MRIRVPLLICLAAFSAITSAESHFGSSIGVRFEAQWRIGDTHPTESRWVNSFAVAKTADLFRFIRPMNGINADLELSQPGSELASVMFEDRSPFILEYKVGSLGDSITMLHGVPVAAKLSPVNSVNGEGTSWAANPWVWVGALAVGAAASGGGSGGDSSSDDGSSSSGETLVGGDQCSGVSGSPTEPEVGSGCQVAGFP